LLTQPRAKLHITSFASVKHILLLVFLCVVVPLWFNFSRAQPRELSGDTNQIHDPVLIEENGKYYVFSTGTGIPIHCSDDLTTWDLCSAVFFGLPKWVKETVPLVGDLWAPDISFFNGKYYLYYAASSFGDNQSAIGLATNKTLDKTSSDYAWQDKGLVIASAPSDNWNAIDPNFVLDASGQPWLAFGSFWSGIKLIKLDETGKPSKEDRMLYSLARRPAPDAIEASFIIYREPYYYLFVSFDQCCQGVKSTYNIRVGRAEEIIGLYLDKDGVAMLEGGGSLVLAGSERWKGPGHNAIFNKDGQDFLVYHSYDAEKVGIPFLRLEPITWVDGWPVLEATKRE
jgi:arabinan endo-1,5-alpha-L-arabinosidase